MTDKEVYNRLLEVCDEVKTTLRKLSDHQPMTVKEARAFYTATRALFQLSMPLYLATNFGGEDADAAIMREVSEIASTIAEDAGRLIKQMNAIDVAQIKGGTNNA